MNVRICGGSLNHMPVQVPASKSLTHRMLICAALAPGLSAIHDAPDNDDIQATAEALRALGATIERKENGLYIQGIRAFDQYDGRVIDCRQSGTTLRFLIPLFSLCERETVFQGSGRLMERPLNVYKDIFKNQGLRFEQAGSRLFTEGKIKAGTYRVPGNLSSQFISGLLMSLPLLEVDSVLEAVPPLQSKPYIDMTLQVMEQAGIRILRNGNTFTIPGHQRYVPSQWHGYGDDSAAAYLLAAGLLKGPSVHVTNIMHDSLQADHAFIDIARAMRGRITEEEQGYRACISQLHGSDIDLADCPDLGPILFVMAACAEGTSRFYHCERLRYKESDRLTAMYEELMKLGCRMQINGDMAVIEGKTIRMEQAVLDGHQDHRIIMALSILALISDQPVVIQGCQAVTKSFPDFFEKLRRIGVRMEYLNTGAKYEETACL